ncbi:MAG: translation initiation factor IF-2 N-terminal domain-containing protein, partial [Candidatus Binatia bacterium]
MPRKRIHELAKEWGMDTRHLLARLEELGIHSKKSQSTLTDHEIALVRQGKSPPSPALVLGEEKLVGERIVTETEREEIRENRIRPNIIRRRTTRVETPQAEDSPPPKLDGEEPALPFTAIEEPFSAPLPPPLPFAFSDVEPAPLRLERSEGPSEIAPSAIPEPDSISVPVLEEPPPVFTAREIVPAPEPVTETPPRQVAPPVVIARDAPSAPTPMIEAPRPPRVLGRIDLGKIAAEAKLRPEMKPRVPAPPAPSRAGAPPVSPRDIAPEAPPPESTTQKRSKKRKVIHKPELIETQERDVRLSRGVKKKRLLPGKEQRQTEITVPKASKRVVRISEVVTVGDLARNLGIKAGEVIK